MAYKIDFEQAKSFWKKKNSKICDDPRVILDSADRILSSFPSCVIATAGESFVDATPVHYIFHNGYVYIYSEGGDKFVNLETNRKVCISVYDHAGDFGNLKSVQVYGEVEFPEIMGEEYLEVSKHARYPIKEEYFQKLCDAGEPMYLLKVIPDRIKVLDSELKSLGYANNQEVILTRS
ncbi:MAG: pyridoxamine 5'-phosphate oxidase family protein [Saccharofermentans sp.]|nr:pyridoxamine 5'-phosphate oxidase family protein [Saccharofermentans sp.]